MSEYGWIWQPLSFLILAICLGFLIVWILFRMSVKDLREEIRNLRDRLRRSESTASKRAKEQNLEAPRLIRHPMQDRRALALVDTGTVQEAEKDVRLSDSEGSDRSPLGRRVRLTKRLGKETQIKLQTSFVGFERMPPQVGRSYRIHLESGKVLCTSTVAQILPRFIETQNSLYEFEVLEER
jgi:hypothetical protein